MDSQLSQWGNINHLMYTNCMFSFITVLRNMNVIFFILYYLSYISSMLITSTGHIKLTDFGLSKIGIMSRK